MERVKSQLQDDDLLRFWENLKIGFDHFEKERQLPKIGVTTAGLYTFEPAL